MVCRDKKWTPPTHIRLTTSTSNLDGETAEQAVKNVESALSGKAHLTRSSETFLAIRSGKQRKNTSLQDKQRGQGYSLTNLLLNILDYEETNQICPECEGVNLTEDKTKCFDCESADYE